MHCAVKTRRPATATNAVCIAAIMLLVATLCWGCGFTWAKAGGETINRISDAGDGAAAWSDIVAGLAIYRRRSRVARDLSRVARVVAASCWYAFVIGFLLATGSIARALGLDHTSEAVCAFLTSLTIVFVPLLSDAGACRSPPLRVWIAVIIALAGVWLMTGACARRRFRARRTAGLSDRDRLLRLRLGRQPHRPATTPSAWPADSSSSPV